MARKTGTGRVMELNIKEALKFGGYDFSEQTNIGERLGGGKHLIDFLVNQSGFKIGISSKWQQVRGTAEQKVPFEYMCLARAIEKSHIDKAYLVLGGPGWTKGEFFQEELPDLVDAESEKVSVIKLEDFIALANQSSI
jgi:hypothetical protein